jgi:sugar phosphate permease
MQAGENSSSRPTQVRWLIFVLACLASWLLYLHRYAWGIMKPDFRGDNPGFDDIEIGWLDSAFLATYGIGQIPGGIAGDRFGPRIMLSVLSLLGSAAVLGVAWTGGFWNLIGARAIFGLAQAGVYPVLNKMTRDWFPLALRTSVQGAVTAMGRVGAACAPLIIASLLMGWLSLSWQSALLVISVPGLILAAGFWFIVRDAPPDVVAPKTDEESGIREGEPPIRPTVEPQPALTLTGASLFSLSMMLLYVFASTFQDQFYVFWVPSFLREAKGFDNETMGLFAPLPFLGGAIGGVLGGILNDVLIALLGNRRWGRSLVAFTGKFTAGVLVLVSMQFEDGRLTMAMLLAVRVFSDWSLPTQWAAVTDMGGRAAATVFGIVNTVGIAGGFVAGPIFGYLKQTHGYDGLFYGVAAMCFFAAVTWLFLDCTKRLVGD